MFCARYYLWFITNTYLHLKFKLPFLFVFNLMSMTSNSPQITATICPTLTLVKLG